jgi:hypothetical protein
MLRPEAPVKEFDNGVGGNEGRLGKEPYCPKLVLDVAGVRPGIDSKRSTFDGDGEL